MRSLLCWNVRHHLRGPCFVAGPCLGDNCEGVGFDDFFALVGIAEDFIQFLESDLHDIAIGLYIL